jgi:peroxiredoxin
MFGQFTASNPWVQGFIGAVCLLMGLSMLDVFVLEMPSSFQSLYTKRLGGAYVNALAAGAVFALIPASCAAPVLLVILAFVAVGANLLYGIVLLFAFGIGVSVLVVLAGTFAGLLTSLPQSGAWMDRIKRGMGWVMVVLGVYFFFSAGRLSQGTQTVTTPGTEVSLSEYRGKVVFLSFWASWCEACMDEIPELSRLYRKYHDQGFEVVGINATDSAAAVATMGKDHNIPYTLLVAAGTQELGDKYKVPGLPANILINRSGVIVYRGGLIPADIEGRIRRLLAEEAAAPAPTAKVGDEIGMIAPDFALPSPEAAREPEPTVGIEVGLSAPEFTLPTVDGTQVSLSDFRGKVVLLATWVTYDNRSVDGLVDLLRLHAEYADEGLEVIAANVGDDVLAVDRVAKERSIPYTFLVGIESAEFAAHYDTPDTPLLLLLDRSGVVAYRGDTLPEDIHKRIAELLEAQPS